MRQPDPRDAIWSAAISSYRKAKPNSPYHEAARAVCFDEPWASEVKARLASQQAASSADSKNSSQEGLK